MRHRLPFSVLIIEFVEGGLYDSHAADVWVFGGAFEESLQTDAYAQEWLAGFDVFADCGEEAGAGELGEAVAEVADAGEDEALLRRC